MVQAAEAADATRWNGSEHARKFVGVRFGEGKCGLIVKLRKCVTFLPVGFCPADRSNLYLTTTLPTNDIFGTDRTRHDTLSDNPQ